MALVSCDFKEIILLIERFKLPMLIAAVALLILFTTTQVFANMFGFFSKEEFELSAPVEGRLLYEEQPLTQELEQKQKKLLEKWLMEQGKLRGIPSQPRNLGD